MLPIKVFYWFMLGTPPGQGCISWSSPPLHNASNNPLATKPCGNNILTSGSIGTGRHQNANQIPAMKLPGEIAQKAGQKWEMLQPQGWLMDKMDWSHSGVMEGEGRGIDPQMVVWPTTHFTKPGLQTAEVKSTLQRCRQGGWGIISLLTF